MLTYEIYLFFKLSLKNFPHKILIYNMIIIMIRKKVYCTRFIFNIHFLTFYYHCYLLHSIIACQYNSVRRFSMNAGACAKRKTALKSTIAHSSRTSAKTNCIQTLFKNQPLCRSIMIPMRGKFVRVFLPISLFVLRLSATHYRNRCRTRP